MKTINLLTGFFSCLFVTPAMAGGFDILGQPNDALFEPGRYVEFGLGFASPNVGGQITAVGPPFASGDTAPTVPFYNGAFKADINEQFSGAVIVDNPYGRKLEYDGGPLSGLSGKVELIADHRFAALQVHGSFQCLRRTQTAAYGRQHAISRFS